MKNFLIVLATFIVLLFTGCSYTSTNDATGVGIPEYVSHIEFYNSGALIGSYDKAQVKILIETRNKLFKVSEANGRTSFITYEIKYNGFDKDYIIDSESLAIKYKK